MCEGYMCEGCVCEGGVVSGLAALLDGELVLLERMAYVYELGFKC